MSAFLKRLIPRPRHRRQRADLPTLAEAEAALGIPAVDWAGHCHEIASAIVDAGLVDGHAVYGDWLGDISEKGHFRDHRGWPFIHHGWIVLRDGRVLDPTRWAFEGKDPYLYVGSVGTEYDEGGNQRRWATLEPPPCARPGDKIVPTEGISSSGLAQIRGLLGDQPVLTIPMLVWVANLPVEALGDGAALVYGAIMDVGYDALIPSDNLMLVARQSA